MKKVLAFVALLCICAVTYGQKGKISGTIKDDVTREPLIGATVLIGPGVGAVTDFDGKFSIEADYGEYTLSVSFVGFEAKTRDITLDRKLLILKDFKLGTTTLTEVQIVADVARERETPVAFTNVLPAQIEEELASQDIPMILNSTPGVYATQSSGGDGDALLLVSDQPMISEGVKTTESDKKISAKFLKGHLDIGIDSLLELKNKGVSVKHLRF